MKSGQLLLSLLLVTFLLGCRSEPDPALPTRLPTVSIPTNPPPASPTLPPTRDPATATPPPSPTAVSTSPPPSTPTPAEPRINLTAPEDGAQLRLGSQIVARGLAQMGPEQTLTLSLHSANGRLLGESEATLSDVGWEASLTVPESVSGAATLRAQIRDGDGAVIAADTADVTLTLDAATQERYIALSRPAAGETAVAGFFLYFEGQVKQPAGNAIRISVWVDECETEAAFFQFEVGGSGPWQGQLGIPRTVSGPACAVASFGAPGEANWREAQVPITIVPPDEEGAAGVQLISPPGGATISAGQEITFTGAAYNAATVLLTLVMDNGRIVAEQTTTPTGTGFWETIVSLPFDIAGQAELTITAQDRSGAAIAETQALFTITEAPTPTPAPAASLTPSPSPTP